MKATATISANGTVPIARATGSDASATALTASLAIIRCLRLTRSASAPAGSASAATGTLKAKPTIPALAGDPVTASTSRG